MSNSEEFPPLDVQEFILCVELAVAAAEQKLAPLTPPPAFGVNLEDEDGRVSQIRFTDHPMNRKAIAIKEHCGADREKCRNVITRYFALESLIPVLTQQGHIKDGDGELFVQEAVFHAAATEPIVDAIRFVEDEFLARVRHLNETIYKD